MSSLPFSIFPNCSSTFTVSSSSSRFTKSLPTKLSNTAASPLLVELADSHRNPTDYSCIGRRGAIGLALFSGILLDVLPPGLSPATANADASPCELTMTASGLAYCDKLVGTGVEAVKGQLIKAHYVGKLENGKVFDSSYNRGKPLTFRVGVGEVIRGWDQGILGGDGVPPMLAGGKRILKIPPELGYGDRGAGCRGGSCIIPPDSVLLFDVEFIGKAA